MSEEERERIRRTIYGAFDRWGQRSMETFLRRFGRGGASGREAFRVEWIEQAFLEQPAQHPGLARYALHQTFRTKGPTTPMTMLRRFALTFVAANDRPPV